MSPRVDPSRLRHGAALASALGLEAAAQRLGMSASRLCEWRKAVEAETGEKLPRKYHWRARRSFPLTATQVAELRARRARGVSWGVLARIYGVSKSTCRRAAGTLPDPPRDPPALCDRSRDTIKA